MTSIGATLFSKIVTHLASSTAASISSLNTSSLFYRMLSWALTAAGVQYNFSNSSAWYICMGSLFGGLIIQGGEQATSSGVATVTFPIAFNITPETVLATGRPGDNTPRFAICGGQMLKLEQISRGL